MKPPRRLSGQAAAWLLARGPEVRQTVRVMAGTALCYAIYRTLNLPQGYWAVFTVVIVMQASIGGTLSASIDRAEGTALGAVVGAIALWLHPKTPVGLGVALTVCVGITGFLAAVRPSLKVAPVTAVIMLISPVGVTIGPFMAAVYRVLEIIIGGVVGVGATLLIFPARSLGAVSAKAEQALALMADVLDSYAQDLSGRASAGQHETIHLRIRAVLTGVESALANADRERFGRVGEQPQTGALPRALWRIRGDIVSVSRALGPLPDVVSEVIAPATKELIACEAAFMRGCGKALRSRTAVEHEGREEALRSFETAIAALRRSRLTHDLDFDAVGHVFGLGFALESLHRNLTDLADRIDETTGASL